MTRLGQVGAVLSRWLDVVAGALAAALDRFRFPRAVEVVEDDGGVFVIRPAKGADTRRTQVPAASASPISSGDKPRSLTNAGRKGDATP